MRIRTMFTVLLLAGLVLVGCQERNSDSHKVFAELIRLYDTRLAEAFAKGDMAGIKSIVTVGHGARLDHRLEGIKAQGRKMESRVSAMEHLEFKDLGDKLSGFPRYRVRTREVWDVRHIDAVTGKTVKEVKGLVYELNYELEQHDGAWQIDSVEVVSEKIAGAPVPGAGSRR